MVRNIPVPSRRSLTITPKGVLAQTLLLLPPQINGRDVAVVGLGPGAHSCNGLSRDRWTYFEIDPVVIKIAKDPEQFGFLTHCAPAAKIILGDARLTLAEQPRISLRLSAHRCLLVGYNSNSSADARGHCTICFAPQGRWGSDQSTYQIATWNCKASLRRSPAMPASP